MSDQARSQPSRPVNGNGCSLPEKVAWLRSQLAPGDEAIETHFAWVFLIGDRAWKLRKPVRRDTMDFVSIEARRVDSEADVRLNRRLAPEVSLRTRPLTRDPQGHLAIAGSGEVVDWLVEMRRIDRSRMLDAMLARGAVRDQDLARVAALLASFYAAEPAAVTQGGALQMRLGTQVEANHAVLATLAATSAADLRAAQLGFIDTHHGWLHARACGGCVIEAHGDLRPEHVLLDDPPAVIDCLEFDRNLRVMDRAEELAFLDLECDRAGHAEVGRRIMSECLARLGDDVPMALASFYRSHRAATRAKLYAWRATEPDGGPPAKSLERAGSYLAGALRAATEAARLSAA
jgi:aminoglycoside phosphotransferase family enzyme